MTNVKIYLCGGIKDLTDEEACEWRNKAIEELQLDLRLRGESLTEAHLAGKRFTCLDPMRRNFRNDEFQSQNEIVQLDKADIINADILLVNATKPSWGTAMEILFAFEHHKLVVVFSGGKYEDVSPWVAFHATKVCKTMEEAVKYVKVNF